MCLACSFYDEFLAHDAYIRTDHGAITMMYVHLSVCLGAACIVIIRCTLVRI